MIDREEQILDALDGMHIIPNVLVHPMNIMERDSSKVYNAIYKWLQENNIDIDKITTFHNVNIMNIESLKFQFSERVIHICDMGFKNVRKEHTVWWKPHKVYTNTIKRIELPEDIIRIKED